MTLGEAVANGMLDTLLADVVASLHTGDPGGDGAHEVTGGSYARQAATFDGASGNVAVLSADVTFLGMPACTVLYWGLWTIGGEWIDGCPISAKPFGVGESAILLADASMSVGV